MKNFVYKDIGQHGRQYQAQPQTDPLAAPLAPKLKLPKQKPATKLHKRLLRSLTLARPDKLL